MGWLFSFLLNASFFLPLLLGNHLFPLKMILLISVILTGNVDPQPALLARLLLPSLLLNRGHLWFLLH